MYKNHLVELHLGSLSSGRVRGKKLLSGPGAQWDLAPPVLLLARPFGWTCLLSAGALMPRCVLVCVYVCVCIHSTDISLAPSAPLKIRRRAERMKRDKVQNKDERRNKRRVASLLFRARTMFGPFSHALYNTLSAPVVYLVSNTISLYFNLMKGMQ